MLRSLFLRTGFLPTSAIRALSGGVWSRLILTAAALLLVLLSFEGVIMAQDKQQDRPVGASGENSGESCSFPTNEAELKKLLTPEQYYITRQNGTEQPFANSYWNNHEAGIYVDVVSGQALFSSTDKFDSGTGWPSFSKPINQEVVTEKRDASHGMIRTEVRSKGADSHLGHLFNDGPGPGGMRYCINSGALKFIPVSQLEAQGYGKYLALFGKDESHSSASSTEAAKKPAYKPTREVATFAGGCFWGVEEKFRSLNGVTDTQVGYEGGTLTNPTYEAVCGNATGHAESVQVEYDPRQISYEKLVRFFFENHDPTTPNRQGPDVGSQYRSVIFFHNAEQEKIAERVKAELQESGSYSNKIVTQIVPASTFWRAEEYHQRYLEKHGKAACG